MRHAISAAAALCVLLPWLASCSSAPESTAAAEKAPSAAEPSPAALARSTGTLIVLNKSDATASLLDAASGETLATLPTGVGPHEVAVSPDGRTAVVCDYGAREPGHTLTLLDLEARAVRHSIELGQHRRPHGIQFAADGRAFVTAEGSRSLLCIDLERGELAAAWPTEQEVSHMVALAPDGTRAFVANIGSGTVTAIDLSTGAILRQITCAAGTEGIDTSPDGREVWAANREADTITVIDAASLEPVASLPCGQFPIRLKFTPDGRHVLVSNARSGDVAVFDAAARAEVRRIPMAVTAIEKQDGRMFAGDFEGSPVPVGILVEPGGKRAFVANTNADVVTVLDLATWTIAGRFRTGREPDGMAWSQLAPR